MKPIITVAGTVGVGKSTLTQRLADYYGYTAMFEQVDNNPYLEKFYHDFEKWSFHLQISFLAERFKQQKMMHDTGGGFVQDRSIYEDKDIFAKNLYDNGSMSEEDFKTYTSLFDAMVLTPYFPKPDCLVYITGPLDEIMGRIKHRGRDMEQTTPVSYWEDLYQRYENWIESFDICPIVKLNITEYDLVNDPTSIERIVEKIDNVISAHAK